VSEALDKSSVPKVAPGTDFTKLPIGAREGFLLSRIDGRTTLGDLAALCGFPADEVERLLLRLMEVRAAYIGDKVPWSIAPPPPPPPAAPQAQTPSPPKARPKRIVRPRRWEPGELDEPVELELELKTRILDLHTYLDELDHYELLEVARDSDRKAIKSAYYGLAAKFHTDRYFGKNLGSYKSKMEAIFSKITAAHDTLANKTRRAEYDEYLVDRDRTKAFERYLSGEDPYEAQSAEEPEPEPEPEPVPEPVPAAPAPAPEAPPSAVRSPSLPPMSEDLRLRREALARRLAGPSTSRLRGSAKVEPPPPASTQLAPPSAEDARVATEALKRRYHDHRDHARRSQARRLIDAADQAIAKNDLLTAANNLRLALGYDEDPALRERYEDVNRRARDLMADTYLKQARYEEQSGKWGPAALSFVKAHDGRPEDASICERAAHALRMEGRDLHKAARFAELAVQKSPTTTEFRITLGAVYLDAGLFLRARSELEHAAKLDPNNAVLKDLLARARKMAS